MNRATIHRARWRSMLLPLVDIPSKLVRIHLRIIRIRHDNRAVRAPHGTPNHIRTGIRRGLVVQHDRQPLRQTEVQRAVGEAVVHGVVDAVRGGVANGEFVHQDPFLDGGDVCDDGHARARDVQVVGDVVDGGVPVDEVFGDLVRELLPVQGVALVGVVAD